MRPVLQQEIPSDALLVTYRGGRHPERWGRYADGFSVIVNRPVSLAAFVYAFYTSWAFRIERGILRVILGAASSDSQARAIAEGSAHSFAIWQEGARAPSQLLMCDRFESTRSWFQIEPVEGGSTRLQFGSGVAAIADRNGGGLTMSAGFRLLRGFHALYSKILLRAAAQRAVRIGMGTKSG